jgi:hypothetical protein
MRKWLFRCINETDQKGVMFFDVEKSEGRARSMEYKPVFIYESYCVSIVLLDTQ